MYTIGDEYAHAEARKSPALDGKVDRDSSGKELRYPVILNSKEKLIAHKVAKAFKVIVAVVVLIFFLFCRNYLTTSKNASNTKN